MLDFETMIWSVHKNVITNVNVINDKYNDNHYAVDLRSFSGDDIATWLEAHSSEAFPINFPTTWFAWDCMQEYLIDPTGWAVQSDISFTAGYPGCADMVAKKTMLARFARAGQLRR